MNADWYYLHLCTSVRKQIGISLSICAHYQQRWSGYIWYTFGGLLTSTSRVHANQLFTTCTFQHSGFGFVYLRSPGGSTVMFRYYLRGGDTTAPTGLYDRLCHAFLVLTCFEIMKSSCTSKQVFHAMQASSGTLWRRSSRYADHIA